MYNAIPFEQRETEKNKNQNLQEFWLLDSWVGNYDNLEDKEASECCKETGKEVTLATN